MTGVSGYCGINELTRMFTKDHLAAVKAKTKMNQDGGCVCMERWQRSCVELGAGEGVVYGLCCMCGGKTVVGLLRGEGLKVWDALEMTLLRCIHKAIGKKGRRLFLGELKGHEPAEEIEGISDVFGLLGR